MQINLEVGLNIVICVKQGLLLNWPYVTVTGIENSLKLTQQQEIY